MSAALRDREAGTPRNSMSIASAAGQRGCDAPRLSPEQAARRTRFALRRAIWALPSTPSGVSLCGRAQLDTDRAVEVKWDEGRAHFSGLLACGSVWVCPPCSARLRRERSIELTGAVDRWTTPAAEGEDAGGLFFLTLTMRHGKMDALADLLGLLKEVWRKCLSGRRWMKVREELGIRATFCATEVTITLGKTGNGWHPHLHVVGFTDVDLTKTQRRTLFLHFWEIWSKALTAAGHPPTKAHGIKLEATGADMDETARALASGRYATKMQDNFAKVSARKVALEATRGDLKRGLGVSMLPVELLELALDMEEGPQRDLYMRLWHEYVGATKGRNALVWSRGAREVLGVEIVSDEEHLKGERTGETVATLSVLDLVLLVNLPHYAHSILETAESARDVQGAREACERFMREQRELPESWDLIAWHYWALEEEHRVQASSRGKKTKRPGIIQTRESRTQWERLSPEAQYAHLPAELVGEYS